MTEFLFLGIEIGGTKLQLGVGAGDGRLLALRRLRVEPRRGAAGILEQILTESRFLAGTSPLAAIGVGFGGPVDGDRGVVIASHQVPGWTGFPLASWLRERLNAPRVVLGNDADTAALGEARFGAGVGLSPVLYVTVGSGIGGGLVVDGAIYRGSGSGAVEIGHLWIADGPRREILERVASGWAMGEAGRALVDEAIRSSNEPFGPLVTLTAGNPEAVTAELIAEAARKGDLAARSILTRAADALATGLAHAATLLAPRRIILGGGVSMIGEDLWLAPVREALNERVFPPFRGAFDLVSPALGEEVVVHGALALARDAAGL